MNKVLDSGFLEGPLTRLGKTERREEFLFLFLFSPSTFYFVIPHHLNAGTGADPGFFLGGGALVSCSTSTPINHIVFFLQNTSCIRKPQVISGVGGGGGVRTLCTLPPDPPLQEHAYVLETVRFIATVNG